MPRYRTLTTVEVANEDAMAMATKIATLHAELVKERLPEAVVNSVLDKVAGAASSSSDGWCRPVAQPGEEVMRPLGR